MWRRWTTRRGYPQYGWYCGSWWLAMDLYPRRSLHGCHRRREFLGNPRFPRDGQVRDRDWKSVHLDITEKWKHIHVPNQECFLFVVYKRTWSLVLPERRTRPNTSGKVWRIGKLGLPVGLIISLFSTFLNAHYPVGIYMGLYVWLANFVMI